MRNRLLAGIAGMIAVAGLVMAQAKVSKKEYDAFMAIQNAPSPEMQMEAADKFVTGFADSSLKSVALFLAANAAERKNDVTKAIVYGQSAIDADPKNYQAMILVAGELARGTHENDLDKEEKLARVDKMANDALELIKTAAKPNPALTDDQWEGAKKDFASQAHEDLGMAATVRKKYDVAITEYKTAIETAPVPNTTTMVRLAGVYDQAGKPNESLALLTKVLADPNLQPVVKQFAEREKTVAEKLKAAAK
jgi:tetratricopeptide (TPR) repeat protein